MKETEYCCYRERPTNKLTECRLVSYAHCAAKHENNNGAFCFSHLEQCRRCGAMLCPNCKENHVCEQRDAA